jgi:hypothetical protein
VGEKQSARVAAPEQLTEYERGFRRAGLPLSVEGFSASTDVFNRAAVSFRAREEYLRRRAA